MSKATAEATGDSKYDVSIYMNIILPMLVWGGLLQYPLTSVLLYHGYVLSGTLVLLSTLFGVYRGVSTRGMCRSLSIPRFRQLGNEQLPANTPCIYLAHPHGLFTTTGMLFTWYRTFPVDTH